MALEEGVLGKAAVETAATFFPPNFVSVRLEEPTASRQYQILCKQPRRLYKPGAGLTADLYLGKILTGRGLQRRKSACVSGGVSKNEDFG